MPPLRPLFALRKKNPEAGARGGGGSTLVTHTTAPSGYMVTGAGGVLSAARLATTTPPPECCSLASASSHSVLFEAGRAGRGGLSRHWPRMGMSLLHDSCRSPGASSHHQDGPEAGCWQVCGVIEAIPQPCLGSLVEGCSTTKSQGGTGHVGVGLRPGECLPLPQASALPLWASSLAHCPPQIPNPTFTETDQPPVVANGGRGQGLHLAGVREEDRGGEKCRGQPPAGSSSQLSCSRVSGCAFLVLVAVSPA